MKLFAAVLSLALLAAFSAPAQESHQAQGVLRGADEAVLSSEMAGRIVGIADEGDTFAKGDLLVEFACDSQKAEGDAARASDRAARARLDNQRRLAETRSAGRLEYDLAEAQQAESRAMIRVADAKASLCRVVAPFSGTVLKREARLHESVAVMAPLLRVARQGAAEVNIIVPASWLPWLKVGTVFAFTANATGERGEGKVTRLGGAVDSASQTMEIKGELTETAPVGLRSGLAGIVSFQAPAAEAPR